MVLDLVLGQLQFIGDFAPKGKGLCIICMLVILGFLDQWMYFCPLWILFFFSLEHMGTIGLSEYHLSFTKIHRSFHHVYLSTTSSPSCFDFGPFCSLATHKDLLPGNGSWQPLTVQVAETDQAAT